MKFSCALFFCFLLLNPPSPSSGGLRVVHVESIAYPDFARAAQVQGTVRVDMVITPQGEVSSAEATSGHPELRKAAIENINHWKFCPISSQDSHFQIEYVFRLEEPKRYYKPETRNVFDLPARVEVISNFPDPQP
jgi:TonB family protein